MESVGAVGVIDAIQDFLAINPDLSNKTTAAVCVGFQAKCLKGKGKVGAPNEPGSANVSQVPARVAVLYSPT